MDHAGPRWTGWTEWGEDVAEDEVLGWDGPGMTGDVVLVRRRPSVRRQILRQTRSKLLRLCPRSMGYGEIPSAAPRAASVTVSENRKHPGGANRAASERMVRSDADRGGPRGPRGNLAIALSRAETTFDPPTPPTVGFAEAPPRRRRTNTTSSEVLPHYVTFGAKRSLAELCSAAG